MANPDMQRLLDARNGAMTAKNNMLPGEANNGIISLEAIVVALHRILQGTLHINRGVGYAVTDEELNSLGGDVLK